MIFEGFLDLDVFEYCPMDTWAQGGELPRGVEVDSILAVYLSELCVFSGLTFCLCYV